MCSGSLPSRRSCSARGISGFIWKKMRSTAPRISTKRLLTARSIIGDFAARHGISYRALKYCNPWLISEKLTNSAGKSYVIKIPKEKF